MYLDNSIVEKFRRFARAIVQANRRFNLTGLKTEEDILNRLIIGSIIPLRNLNISKATSFIDLGSGAGIPGIPLGLFFQDIKGVLIESHEKKADFIRRAIDDLSVHNLKVICGRVEDIIKEPEYRESADWIFARAFNDIYITIEFGAPFLRISGHMYIYSDIHFNEFPEEIIRHAERLGIRFIPHDKYMEYGVESGLLLSKYDHSPDNYPRRFPVVKRESRKIKGGKQETLLKKALI